MRHLLGRPALAAAALAAAAAPLASQEACPAGPHALVLSGGGAKGLAHVGVLQVLDSMGRRPDLIVGTSMGAVVGALYASGYDSRALDSIVQVIDVPEIFRSARPLAPRAFGGLEPLLYWEQGRGGLGLAPASVLDTRLNARLNEVLLAGNLAAGGTFDSLPIPFAAVAAALVSGERVLLERGDLARAVRASMSIPVAFYPQVIDGRVLVDGGLADNTPIKPARERGAATLTVVNVSDLAGDTVDINSTPAILSHLLDLFMAETDDTLRANDVYVRPDISGIGTMDFDKAKLDLARQRGLSAARQAFAAASCLPPSAPPLRPRPGPWRLDALTISAARDADARFLRRAFGLTVGDTIDQERMRATFRALERSPERREVWLNPRRGGDSLSLHLTVTPPPPRSAGVLIAVDADLGGRLGVLGVDRTVFGGRAEASAGLLLSSLQQTLLLGVRPLPAGFDPVTPELRLRLSAEYVRLFDSSGSEVSRPRTSDALAFLGIGKSEGAWLVQAGPVAWWWRDPSGSTNAVGVGLRAVRGTATRLPRITLEAFATDAFARAQFDLAASRTSGGWTSGIALRLAASDRPPLQMTVPMGGVYGFPGYRMQELRGTDEASTSLTVGRRVLGPVALLAELAAGRSWGSARDEWLGGARVGFALPTPLGPLVVAWGRASSGREAWYGRLGAWF